MVVRSRRIFSHVVESPTVSYWIIVDYPSKYLDYLGLSGLSQQPSTTLPLTTKVCDAQIPLEYIQPYSCNPSSGGIPLELTLSLSSMSSSTKKPRIPPDGDVGSL